MITEKLVFLNSVENCLIGQKNLASWTLAKKLFSLSPLIQMKIYVQQNTNLNEGNCCYYPVHCKKGYHIKVHWFLWNGNCNSPIFRTLNISRRYT